MFGKFVSNSNRVLSKIITWNSMKYSAILHGIGGASYGAYYSLSNHNPKSFSNKLMLLLTHSFGCGHMMIGFGFIYFVSYPMLLMGYMGGCYEYKKIDSRRIYSK